MNKFLDLTIQELIMIKKIAILSTILILIIVVSFFAFYYYTKVKPNFQTSCTDLKPPISISLVENYFKITYNSSLKLFSECPFSDTYYIESDNLLAVIALKYLNNSLWKIVWQNIERNITISPYLVLMNVHNFTWKFNTPITVHVYGPIYTIEFNGSSYLSWYEYADTSFLYAIYEAENGNISIAEKVFATTINNFWNGSGFIDAAFNGGTFDSYKLALAIIAWKYIAHYNETFALQYLPIIKQIYNISSHLQSSIGGFFTNYVIYDGHVIAEGNVNTETTSLFVIAFLMQP